MPIIQHPKRVCFVRVMDTERFRAGTSLMIDGFE